jgi:hypothetical protein
MYGSFQGTGNAETPGPLGPGYPTVYPTVREDLSNKNVFPKTIWIPDKNDIYVQIPNLLEANRRPSNFKFMIFYDFPTITIT